MLLSNYDLFGKALTGVSPLNGMYIVYGAAGFTPPALDSSSTLTDLRSAVSASSSTMGLSRVSGVTALATSGGVMFIATTANNEDVCGLPLSAGVTISAAGLGSLSPNVYGSGGTIISSGYVNDQLMDYNTISGGVVVPAGGFVTITDEVTL